MALISNINLKKSTDILQQYWGFDSFRGLQQPIIDAVVAGQDVLALLPTGGGKSICFQVPALLSNGMCLVVSPLIALMKDQVQHLTSKGIAAAALFSGLSQQEVEDVLYKCHKGELKFLYVSPERLESKLFKAYLPDLPIKLLAVDEAHCISQWGYDFRPPYLKIASIKYHFPKIPVIALTASATGLVQKDIVEKLKLFQPKIFQQSFERKNISYSAFKVDSKINKLIEVLNRVDGCSIVYCKNRKQTNYVAQLIQLQNITADYYHAGLPQDIRNNKQEDWMNNTTRVMVCTNAFGMGIDKPDVRTVIHYDAPDCVENYYQEAGRAGRDGRRAFAVLLYHVSDIDNLQLLPELKYPSVSDIKKVYQCVVDYLKIPVGIGEGNYYDFDISLFSKIFKIEIQLALNVLKTLEHEGYIVLTDSIFIPTKIKFIADRFTIETFEQNNVAVEPVVKSLLRTYSGILDNLVSVNEKTIAKVCKLPLEKITQCIELMQQQNIIQYIPQKETPQIYFITNRAAANDLQLNHTAYFKRKQHYQLRVDAMLRFIKETSKCRSQIISNYFDAGALTECGSCDNCLSKKNNELSPQEFIHIQQEVLEFSNTVQATVKGLLQHLAKYKKEKIWKVISFLQDEKKIVIDETGSIKKL